MTLVATDYIQHLRNLGILEDDTVYWYWIGKRDEYDRILG